MTHTHFSRTLVTASAFALTALVLHGCHGATGEDPAVARERVEQNLAPREIRLISPEAREEHRTVSLVGEIRPFDTVTISTEVAGLVEEVLVEVGDRVVAGQPLVQIDRATFRLRSEQAAAELDAARADLELASRELERKRDLLSDRTIPQAAFDQATATFDLARARVAAAEATLGLAERDFAKSIIRAPAAGAVTVRHAVIGQWADVGFGMVDLALGDRVKIAARVPSSWAASLQGLEGFDFTVRPDEPLRRAKLYSVDPVIEESSRSFDVVGTAPGAGLKPGLFANVHLTSPESMRSLWVPATAVMASDTPRLLVVESGRAEVLKIQTGRRDDGMIEVVSGLEEGQPVIQDVAGLTRGLPVTVVE